ncbi:HAMP domain-containing sensor histidine kinase [Halobacteriovorax sp. GB3]|uniref:sensor histidine kinase n=1 Tax=Halobacteriovorax sp. GB3 TaxID=2719615 RepID=UPI002361CFBF|nr:HAMP domain-containing sensor histidine kinase [Halobacteriovorax sp. GB3]MDD0853282.1 HAMP domain-containing sensor histidine kinase [Halobacteriovorax sp. GB3]
MTQKRVFPILATLWITTSLALGSWWLYLLVMYEDKLEKLGMTLPELGFRPNLVRMLKWEGTTLILLITFLSISLFILYYKDQRKTKALQAFFAGLTHELKTPLASIRLQAEVINDTIEEKYKEDKLLDTLTDRLIEDTGNLETQMDKILQLSRIERGGNLNPAPVDLMSVLRTTINKRARNLSVEIDQRIEDPIILADLFALELILKNLFENTKAHTEEKKANIKIDQKEDTIILVYNDGGTFQGEIEKLGNLFYKFNSAKGSGIGLYLIKKLMEKMSGSLVVENKSNLVFTLYFKKETES